MQEKSMQAIEDFYLNLGYQGYKLRKVLKEDRHYQELLQRRKQRLTKQFQLTPLEKSKYVLATDIDFEILAQCKKLEKLHLTSGDKILVQLIKSQLEDDWRKPLLKILNQLLKKYKKKNF
ncbi:MAG: hypothetical protein PHW01_00555 [Patescibacteria group bacterium]|nr:hypothetical protein [Patescibacteria group bacterium]